MKVFVIDTNVIVSAAVGRNPDSPPRRIVTAMLMGSNNFAISAELLDECLRVLLEPKISMRNDLTRLQIEQLLTDVEANAVMYSPRRCKFNATDPKDQVLMDLVVALPDSVLITGDKALLHGARAAGCQVWTPRQWLDAQDQ